MGDQSTRLAQAVGIAAPAFLSGFIFSFSHAGVPTLSVAPISTLVHEFKVMYNIGKATAPPLAIGTAVCHGYMAYSTRDSTRLIAGAVSPFTLHVLAAFCVVCIVPFTLLYMDPAVNNRLLELGARVERGEGPKELETDEKAIRQKLIRWRGLNLFRACAVGASAVLGTIAVFV